MINYHDVIVYETFPFTLKRKAGVFKFLCLEERFQKALFSCRIRVDGRLTNRNKAALA